jgi:TATA-box binding protein (TBP) (component of TFIID and TFIIIB)
MSTSGKRDKTRAEEFDAEFGFEDEDLDDIPEVKLASETADFLEPVFIRKLEITDKTLRSFAHSFDKDERLFHANCLSHPPLPEVSAVLVMNNVVHTHLSEEVNWALIVNNGARFGFHFSVKKFGATDLVLVNPRTTVRSHRNNICCNGATNIMDAIYAIQFTVNSIRSIKDEFGMLVYPNLHCTNARIVNVCGIIDLGFGIDISRLSNLSFVKPETADWKAAHVRVGELAPDVFPGRNVNVMVNLSGNINISGARSRDELAKVYSLVIQLVQENSAQSVPLKQTKAEDRRRKWHEAMKLTSTLPEDSLALVRVQNHVIGNSVARTSTAVVKSAMMESSLALARRVVAIESFTKRDEDAKTALMKQLDDEIAPPSKRTRVVSKDEAYSLALENVITND